ncbi:MAG TPA: biotin/lipoyl-containing protein [Gemmatimonadaceae bacterium]|nr:biotin/lipoyl-containing protein [Gemmatimonadaceae bacterium]
MMKYIVIIDGRRVEVGLGPEGVEVNGRVVAAELSDVEGTPVRLVRVGDHVHRVIMRQRVGKGHYRLWLDGYCYDVEALDERARTIRDLAAAAAPPATAANIVAPMPGLVVRVRVEEGQSVAAGQGVVVIEAMKMENELRSPGPGRVKRVYVAAGTAVERGSLLIEME